MAIVEEIQLLAGEALLEAGVVVAEPSEGVARQLLAQAIERGVGHGALHDLQDRASGGSLWLSGDGVALAQGKRAAGVWSTIDVRQGQLDLRRGWYEVLKDQERSAWVVLATTLTERMPARPPA
jgi:hypothetical protein